MAESRSLDDLEELLRATTRGVSRLADVLRALDHETVSSTIIGDWTLSQTMAHVISTARLYRRILTGWPSPLQAGGLPTLNAGYFAGLVEERPDVLAALLEEAVELYAAKALEVGPNAVCSWHLGMQLDVVTITGFLANENLMHGWDIARAVGVGFVDDEAALPVLATLTPVTTQFVDPETLKWPGHLVLCPEGGQALGIHIAPEGASYVHEEVGVGVDCYVTGPAFSILLWRGGRVSWEQAGLTSSGRRPELAESFRYLRF